MPTLTSQRETSEITLKRGIYANFPWSQVNIQIFDASNDPVDTSTGTITGSSRPTGSTKFTNFDTSINLSSDAWYWVPNLANIAEFRFTATGLPTNYSFQVTLNNWGLGDA